MTDTKLEHKTQQNDNKLNYKMYYKSVIVHKNRIFTYFENKVKKLNNMIIIIVIIKHGWNKNNVSIQHINLYELLEATASIIKYTSIQILNCLQKLIHNLLNLQTMYPIATNESYQNFIADIIKLK